MLLLIIFGIFLQLTFGAQVPQCKAVNYFGEVIDMDANFNFVATVYIYNFKLKIALNAENITDPNTVTVSNFEDWSLNTSAYFRTSPLRFVYGYFYMSDYSTNCTYFNETCVFSFPNGQISRHFNMNYGNYGSLDLFDRAIMILNSGVILGGDQGYVMDQTNPCTSGERSTYSGFGKYNFASNATVCCIEYDYVEVPDNTERYSNYYDILLGEISRQNGTFRKNNYQPFTSSDPCTYKSSDLPFTMATYNSSFCCTKFVPDTTTTITISTTSTPPTTTPTTTTTAEPTPTTPAPITDPRSDYIGTPCSTDISQVWLDIVFVVDTSKLMTKTQLQQLSAQISTYMQGFTFAPIGQHTVRAAIIVYSIQVTTIYQLTDTTDFDAFVDAIYDLENYANPDDEGGNLQGALQQAYNLSISQKSQRRPLIVLIAAAYNPTGFQGADLTANTIKANGICIVVINFKSSQGVLATALQNISCDGYYYVSNDFDLESKFRYALTQLNCICPQGSLQFREYNTAWQNFTNYADCMYGYQTPTAPKFAERSCNPGTLAAVTSQSKLDFITDNVLPYVMPKEKRFTIGLHKSDIDGEWKWWGYNKTKYPLGEYPAMVDPPVIGDNYGYMWNHYGFNWTLQTGNNIPLPYICQSHACDAEFICDMTPAKSVLRD